MIKFKQLVKRLLDDPHYRNILMFMYIFEVYRVTKHYQLIKSDQIDEKKDYEFKQGLEQKHFRYYLMKDNHGLDDKTIVEMQYFDDINKDTSVPPRNAISSQKDLNYYLKYLQQKKVITSLNQRKPLRYVLTKGFYAAYDMIRIEERFENWSAADRKIFYTSDDPDIFEETILFGMPKDLTPEQSQIIFTSINEIKKVSNDVAFLYHSEKKHMD